ncbi:hypothetical protein CIPAW_10G167700 [Carya illinoinensis]|uniref:Uncharacterized protein n=1 Tax=Carya illinoinensis TaxID=32201 RepID=A0A8T1PEA3_CARIL|nr:hypothetical protein CIPAW_10G167700 [Carya illinoinensis]
MKEKAEKEKIENHLPYRIEHGEKLEQMIFKPSPPTINSAVIGGASRKKILVDPMEEMNSITVEYSNTLELNVIPTTREGQIYGSNKFHPPKLLQPVGLTSFQHENLDTPANSRFTHSWTPKQVPGIGHHVWNSEIRALNISYSVLKPETWPSRWTQLHEESSAINFIQSTPHMAEGIIL